MKLLIVTFVYLLVLTLYFHEPTTPKLNSNSPDKPKFVGVAPRVSSAAPSGFLTPSTLNSWSADLIRTKTRCHFPRPNEKKRIKKHGWWTRMATIEGRKILQRRILKGRYILMIMKAFGCRPMNSIYRCYSEACKVKRKLNRNFNFYVPIISEQRKQSIKTIVSLQMSGKYMICTTILREGNILDNWKTICMPEDMNKFHLDNVYQTVVGIMNELPDGDVYLFENYMKMPNNVNVASANLFYVKLQMLAMIIALINNGSRTENSSDNTQESTNKVILMKARVHARLFKIIIGSEIISSQEITALMLKGTFPDYVTPVVPALDAVLSFRSVQEPIVRELMSNGLMLAMSFIDLVLNTNPKSIQALNESSKRKLKTT